MQIILLSFLILSTLLYLTQTYIIYRGTCRLNYNKVGDLPTATILIALRNEEKTLNACVQSLLALDYPREKFEIILINDRSIDRTGQMIEALAFRNQQIKTIHISASLSGLSGKANAIAHGMKYAKHELILVTDADCVVPRTWVKAHASFYDKDVGLVGGFTLLDSRSDRNSLFDKVQSLDWAYLLAIGTGAIGYARPLSVLGNNFSFRSEAYQQVGGYQKMGFTIIEDFALMKALISRTGWKVRYPIEKEMLVYSLPMATMSDFYQQRKRWSAGGKEVGWYGKFLMGVSFLTHLFIILSLFLGLTPAGLLALSLIIAADFALLSHTTARIGRGDLLRVFAAWETFYFAYTLLFAPVLLFPTKVVWKDTVYSWKFNWRIRAMYERSAAAASKCKNTPLT